MHQKVEYVIFDLDGLLVDTESTYTIVTNEILGRYGKEMTMDIKAGLMGMSARRASEYLLSFFPDIDLTVDDYLEERERKQDLLWPTTLPMPGSINLITYLHKHSIPIAVATGSDRRVLKLKTSHLPELIEPFGEHIICAEDVERGKPFPDIFLKAAQSLGRNVGGPDQEPCTPEQLEERKKGLVFEDAIPGIRAAVAANMQAIWVPDLKVVKLEEGKALHPGEILSSLKDFKPEHWGLPPYFDNNEL